MKRGRRAANVAGVSVLAIVVAAMAATVLAVAVGDRLRLPWPALMVLFGMVVAVVPGVPHIRVEPDLILPVLLPPLLFAAAQRTSWSLLRSRWRAVLLLAVALTSISIVAVAGTAAAIVPGITVTAAVALAAAVAPPDPVAVEALGGPLHLPGRVLSVLKSEGLFNDAVSLVVFQTALAALAAGRSFGPRVVLGFGYGLVVAVALGYLSARLVGVVRARITDVSGRNALNLVVPFAVYLAADGLQASGVIAVITLALQLGEQQDAEDGDDRLSGAAFWGVIELLATGITFALIGLELRVAVGNAGGELPRMLRDAAVISAVLVVVRLGWMLAAIPVARRLDRVEAAPRDVRDCVLMTACGMRGVVTLALALALPSAVAGGAPFPARTEALVVAGTVIVVTLLVPSFTLGLLVRALGIAESGEVEAAAERPLLVRARRAAADAVRNDPRLQDDDPETHAATQAGLDRLGALLDVDDGGDYQQRRIALRTRADKAGLVREVALEAARAEVLAARREPGTEPDAVDRVLRRLDQRIIATRL